MNNTVFSITFSLLLVMATSNASNAMQWLRDCKKLCSLEKCAGNKARQTECSKKCPKEPCVPLRPETKAYVPHLTHKQLACIIPINLEKLGTRAYDPKPVLIEGMQKNCPEIKMQIPPDFFESTSLHILNDILWEKSQRFDSLHHKAKPSEPLNDDEIELFEDVLEQISKEHYDRLKDHRETALRNGMSVEGLLGNPRKAP